jgi:hypothetical protein
MRNDKHANALGELGLYIAQASFSKALGLLAAGAALHILDGHPFLALSAVTAGAASLGATVGRLLDSRTKRPRPRSQEPPDSKTP